MHNLIRTATYYIPTVRTCANLVRNTLRSHSRTALIAAGALAGFALYLANSPPSPVINNRPQPPTNNNLLFNQIRSWNEELERNVPQGQWGREVMTDEHRRDLYRDLLSRSPSYNPQTMLSFLEKIREMEDYQRPRTPSVKRELIIEVDHMLKDAASHEAFRNAIMPHLEMSLDTCRDNKAVAFDTVKLLRNIYVNPPTSDLDFAKLLVGWRRINILKQFANTTSFDAVVVFLGLAFVLKDCLFLPISLANFTYIELSHVIDNDRKITQQGAALLTGAYNQVKEQTQTREQICNLLSDSNVSEFWIDRLKQKPEFAQRFTELQDQHYTQLEKKEEELTSRGANEDERTIAVAELFLTQKEETKTLIRDCTNQLLDRLERSQDLLAPDTWTASAGFLQQFTIEPRQPNQNPSDIVIREANNDGYSLTTLDIISGKKLWVEKYKENKLKYKTFFNPDGTRSTFTFLNNGKISSLDTFGPRGNLLGTTKYREDETAQFLLNYYQSGALATLKEYNENRELISKKTYEYYENGAIQRITIFDKKNRIQELLTYTFHEGLQEHCVFDQQTNRMVNVREGIQFSERPVTVFERLSRFFRRGNR